MTIWYDVSGLVGWQRSHLGGIERTIAGILEGLHDLGVVVRLVHLPPGGDRFVEVSADDLPAAAWSRPRRFIDRPTRIWHRVVADRHVIPPPSADYDAPIENAAAETTAVEIPPAAPPPPPRRRPLRDALYGPGPDGVAFRAAWHAFKAAGRELVRHAGQRAGLGRTHTIPAAPPPVEAPAVADPVVSPLPPQPEPDVPFVPGDLLLSFGGTFAMPGHPAAVDAARVAGAGVVRMVYDLIAQTKPQWVAPQPVYVHWLRHVVTASDMVLAISEFTRQELLAYCRESGLVPPPTAVVRLGDVLRHGTPPDLPPPLPRFVPQRPFFLCVSTLDVRKNHRCLYEAWAVLAAERAADCPDLLCTGMPHAGVADLVYEIRHDPVVNRHLHLLDGIHDAELDWYYRHCVATIYPSKHEGWGLPVAESLAHGKLCLASSASSIPEIDARLPEFFAPHDTARLVSLVRRAIDEPAWIAAREAAIRREFQPTPWTDTAAAVVAAVKKATGPSGVAA